MTPLWERSIDREGARRTPMHLIRRPIRDLWIAPTKPCGPVGASIDRESAHGKAAALDRRAEFAISGSLLPDSAVAAVVAP
jgi:hypothetical protein